MEDPRNLREDHTHRLIRAIQDYIRHIYRGAAIPIKVAIWLNCTAEPTMIPILPMDNVAVESAAQSADEDDPERRQGRIRHGPGFRSVVWFGRTFALTKAQAKVVEVLWGAWEQATPDVPDDLLIAAAGSDAVNLRDVFRRSEAWGGLIRQGATTGTHRLAEPGDEPGEGPE